ncbi:MAG: heme-binding domain-containing protein [Chloroflexota bacterium]
MVRWIVQWGLIVALAGGAAIQLVPHGRNHTNPPVRAEPAWDSPRTRELAVRACFDCHSNQTVWPWYSQVAPVSWLVQRDVEKGRRELNFSEWGLRQEEAEDASEEVQKGKMPPLIYTLMHSEATLTSSERQELVRGLGATLGADEQQEKGERTNGEDEEED